VCQQPFLHQTILPTALSGTESGNGHGPQIGTAGHEQHAEGRVVEEPGQVARER